MPDSTEKETLALKGEFSIIKGEAGTEIQTVPYEYTFKQNTPPDDPKNLHNPSNAEVDNYHCLHFDTPDQSLERNQNLTYFIECFDTDGNFIASVTIEPDEINTADKDSGTSEFDYYFASQTETLQYDYRVTFLNNHGLSVYCATSGNLGKCVANEPVITFGSNGTYNGQKNGDYDVIEYTGSSLSLSVAPKADNETVTVKINGADSSLTTTLTDGNSYTIVATSTKNLAEPVTITKKVYAVKALTAPNISFSNSYSDDDTNVTYSYLANTTLNVNIATPSNPSGTTYNISLTNCINETSLTSCDYNYSLAPGTYTFTATAQRTYCQDKTFTRTIIVKIKPITVTSTDSKIWCNFTDTGGTNEVIGGMYLQKEGGSRDKLYNFGDKGEYLEFNWTVFSTYGNSYTLKELTEKITASSDDLYEDDTFSDNYIGNFSVSKTLQELCDEVDDEGNHFIQGVSTSSEQFTIIIYFTLTD